MPQPRRTVLATVQETSTPPVSLAESQSIARVIKAVGNNLYSVESPSGKTLLVELPSRFRSTVWIRRGGYVLVDRTAFGDRENKLDGEIINVVGDEKVWRKKSYWPKEFGKTSSYGVSQGDEEDVVGRMPPDEDED